MQGDMKKQEGESCRNAVDIFLTVFKLLRSFVIDIDPVWAVLLYCISPCSGCFERSRS